MGVSEQQGDDAAGDLAQAHPESVARIVYASQRAGIAKLGFITEPPPRG